MKFEITVTEFPQITNMSTIYRYDCFIDDVFITFGTWTEKQDLYWIYTYFIDIVLREWNTKYKNKYGMNKITRHNMKGFNPVTIIREEIENIDLTLKRATEFIRLQKIEEDF